jgi:PIN domain nuclease of toxin-antitoxin system
LILLDTHVLLWLANDDRRLGRRTLRRIDRALASGGVAVSALSFCETANLVHARRLDLGATTEAFRAVTLKQGILEIVVDGEIAIASAGLTGMHADPADRIIVATALARSATLVTADQKILGMKSGPVRIDAQT